MIVDQLFTPKPLEEGGPYDLPGIDYPRSGDTPPKRRSAPSDYPYSKEQDDDYFREIFRKKREAAAKAAQDKQQGVAEGSLEEIDRRGFLQGLGMAAAGAAGLGAAGTAQARATPEWMSKVERAKTLMAKGQSREQTARIMGIKGPNPGGAGPMSGDWGAVNYAAQEMRVKESTDPKQHRLNEAMLMEDPVYRSFKRIGGYIAERKMSEKEILDVFAQAEAGMTNTGTGANRTMLGRGKDATSRAYTNVKDSINKVLDSIQNSAPVAGVDVAYDQATDALANAVGQDSKVMDSIKKYRLLAKEYPKTQLFVKTALIALAGLATGGAALPVIAGLTAAVDSAIKGEKLSSIIGKGAGAGLMGLGAQEVSSMLSSPTGEVPVDQSLAPGEEMSPEQLQGLAPSRFDQIVSNAVDYKVKPDDTLSDILADRKINPEAFKRLPGNEVLFSPDGNPNIIKAGQTIKLPDPADIADLNRMSFTTPSDPNLAKDFGNPDFYTGQYNQNSTSGLDAANNLRQQELGRFGSDNGMSAARVAQDAGVATGAPADAAVAIDYTKPGPETTDSLGQKLEYGVPVNDQGSFVPPNPSLPAAELAKQTAAYNSWLADFMKRFPSATQGADGVMQGLKPGLAPMSNYTPGMDTGGLTPKAVQESVRFKILPAEQLIDQKLTVLTWALNESVDRKSNNIHLTTRGVYTVFENVDRYRRAIVEYTQPGREQIPNLLRPDMPGAPVQQTTQPGMIGRGLNALDRFTSRVGGGLSNFGRQFTTGVTKEKLKMNWQQAGKPTDSDQLAAWLVTQKVPQEVVSGVFNTMGIPYTVPTASTTVGTPATQTGGAQRQAYAGINPATKKPWTVDELQARMNPATAAAAPTTPTATTTATTTTTAAAGGPGFNAGNVMSLPGMEKYAKKTATPPAKTPNFAGPTGYGKTTTSFKQPGTTPAPTTAKLPAGGGAGVKAAGGLDKKTLDYINAINAKQPESMAEAKQIKRITNALTKPVAEMLQMVETKEDVQRIKKFIDDTFVKHSAVSESAFAVRNRLIEHITQVGAQRRREHAHKS